MVLIPFLGLESVLRQKSAYWSWFLNSLVMILVCPWFWSGKSRLSFEVSRSQFASFASWHNDHTTFLTYWIKDSRIYLLLDRSTLLSGPHKCNKTITTIQLQYNIFFFFCTCIALVRTPAIQRCNTSCNTSFLQLEENLQATSSSCKKICIVVVLRLCGLLQYSKIFVLLL